MLKKIVVLLILTFSFNIQAAESNNGPMPKHKWSFNGITGTFDRAALQRGFKVYREVWAGCHSMKLLYYRDLIDIGFSEAQVKAIAAEYDVLDGPNDDGTDTNAKQLSEDVVTFLKWSAEPELEVRKNMGIKVILFFLILGTVVYLAKNRLWRDVH